MLITLPEPQVLRCYFDESVTPHLPAMCLRWNSEPASAAACTWGLPGGVNLMGPLPERFGVSIRRTAQDAYDVRLLWARTYLAWRSLPRAELLDSALAPLLAALGTDLWYLLEQPITDRPNGPDRAA